MPLPRGSEYLRALNNLAQNVCDPELKQCLLQRNSHRQPKIYSGGFALTCPVTNQHNSNKWAIRCFYRLPNDIEERYQEISKYINKQNLPWFTQIEFYKQGISVKGNEYPICKMKWLEGQTLHAYLSNRIADAAAVARLPGQFREMIEGLERFGVAHGDLHHDNILIVNDQMMLVDYDGMFVPALAGREASEIGMANYQHPQRAYEPAYFGPYIDRFSAISIYISLLAIREQPHLYEQYNDQGCALLFKKEDYLDPENASIFRILESIPSLRKHIQSFRNTCKTDIRQLPTLSEFLSSQALGSSVRLTKPNWGFRGIPIYDDMPIFHLSTCDRQRLAGVEGHLVTLVGLVDEVNFVQESVSLRFTDSSKLPLAAVVIIGEAVEKLDMESFRARYNKKWIKISGVIEPGFIEGIGYQPIIEVDSLNSIKTINLKEAFELML